MIVKKNCLLVSLLFIAFFTQAQCISGDCLNGTGTAVIDSSIMYIGTFKNGLPDGEGIFSNAFGRIYDGGVWKGLYHGKGKLVYNNGDFYVGDFKQGLRHGKGIFSSATGIVMNGRFLHDRYIDTTEDANTWLGHDHFTSYDLNNIVFSSDNKKVAVIMQSSPRIKIFDATTGKYLEIIQIVTMGIKSFKNSVKLYLDFGREYETHIYDKDWHNTLQLICPAAEKLNSKNSSKYYIWEYQGKTTAGEALFWLNKQSYDNPNIETSLIAYQNAKAAPRIIIKPSPGVSLETPIPPGVKMASDEIKWNRLQQHSTLRKAEGVLVCLLDQKDPDYLLPLIDPNENVETVNKQSNYLSDMRQYQEDQRNEMIAKYKRQMAGQYGEDWEQKFSGNPLQQKVIPPSSGSSGTSNHTCQVCMGSGKVVDELQDNLVQDKNSGRWYKKLGTVYKNCLRCGGKGYVSY